MYSGFSTLTPLPSASCLYTAKIYASGFSILISAMILVCQSFILFFFFFLSLPCCENTVCGLVLEILTLLKHSQLSRVVQELGEDAPAKPSCRSSAEVPLLKAGSGTVLKHTRYTH